MSNHTATLKRGQAATVTRTGEPVTIVRAEWLSHPAYVDVDGPVPARRERWLHVRFADGARLLTHPDHLTAA